MLAKCSLIVCYYRVFGDLNTVAKPSICAFISTVYAISWNLTLPIRATYLQNQEWGTDLLRRKLEEFTNALLRCNIHLVEANRTCYITSVNHLTRQAEIGSRVDQFLQVRAVKGGCDLLVLSQQIEQ